MHFEGIIIGLSAFVIIGLYHPLVIYAEYHFGVKIWPLFLCLGIILCIASVIMENVIVSAILGIAGFSCFWGIHELYNQKKRVEKGWFPPKK
ncbi:MAG: DUF4491 family protein [Treponema sp.]|jgi:hypothetical protein|nr:DUF4491 family protein [Treponema sp.]